MIFRFADPVLLWLLLGVAVLIWADLYRMIPQGRVRFSRLDVLRQIPGAVSDRSRWILSILRWLALCFIVVAAARPQSGSEKQILKSRGVDIVIALDISGSMRALDFQPSNRLEVAKNIITEFIEGRPTDRIGLVLFGSDAFTLCPLTLDHDLLVEFLKQAKIGMVEEKTAIGKAIATAVNRLRLSEHPDQLLPEDRAKSQLVILLTDGVNTVTSRMDPLTAAKAAESFKIKINTIGIGKNGPVDFPHPNFPGRTVRAMVDFDEETLKSIAQTTGGDYFHALDTQALKRVFDTIDQMEKVEIESLSYTRYTELYGIFLVVGFIFLVIQKLLRDSVFRRLP